MPDKENPARQIPVAPRFFLAAPGPRSRTPPCPNRWAPRRRELAASYITGQDNPWFARAFVNRTWYALVGETLYDSIDDLGPERTPRAPEVLEPLADQWQRGGYDIRWLYRTILNTRAYQRRVRSTANAAGKTPFASNCPSRLRADQVFEALAQALGLPLDNEGHLVLPAQNNKNPRPARRRRPSWPPACPSPPARSPDRPSAGAAPRWPSNAFSASILRSPTMKSSGRSPRRCS